MAYQQKVMYENLTHGEPGPLEQVGEALSSSSQMADTTMDKV